MSAYLHTLCISTKALMQLTCLDFFVRKSTDDDNYS